MGRGFRLKEQEVEVLRAELERAHGNKEYALSLKLRTLLAVGDGRAQTLVADTFSVPLRTLQRWIQRYRVSGVTGLINGPYPGKHSRLSAEQKAELSTIIEEGPEKQDLETGVWTAPIIVDLVSRRFGIDYSASQIRRILHELGFSLQYPRQKLSKADRERQTRWLRAELPAIKKRPEQKAGW
jgi:transposase